MLAWNGRGAFWRLFGCAALVAVCPGESPRRHQPPPALAPARYTGQWIWSETDRQRFRLVHAESPTLVPGVLAGTVVAGADGKLTLRRGLSPGGTADGVVVVVRLDDSAHLVWRRAAAIDVAKQVVPLLAGVLEDVRRAGVTPRELQLDYDCPEQRLADWAFVVGEVARSTEVPLWITSIPAHLEQKRYGELFAGRAAGHVMQLFDTGLPCTHGNAVHVAERVAKAGLPFRVGVAAFERVGRASEHACWRRAAGELRGLAGYSGDWVFPGGEDVRIALAEVPTGRPP